MTVDADAIVLAVGQRAESAFLPAEVVGEQGWIRIDDNGRTRIRGVYAGGDAVRPANVIDAIAAGKRTAAAIHADLTGGSFELFTSEDRFLTFDPQCLDRNHAAEPSRNLVEARTIDREDSASLPVSAVEAEARRCMNCGCVAVTHPDMGTALVALDAVIQTTNGVVPAGEFFACRERASTVLELGELVTEVRIHKAKSGSSSAYRKFRRRQSIDFAIVSAAVCLDVAQDKVRDARVVLGAVAPVPVRAQAAEGYLRGKDIEEVLAPSRTGTLPELAGARAAELALEQAIPLPENRYKAQLARAMVRRAILASLS
jgi:CO/xanthine dehydrogenase FAD-binding subunit